MTIRRWLLRLVQTPERAPQEAAIKIDFLTMNNGSKINFDNDTVLVITGPNNVGKSAVLRGVYSFLVDGRRPGPVLTDVNVRTTGTEAAFTKAIKAAGMPGSKENEVKIGTYDYSLDRVRSDLEDSFIGRYPMQFFVSRFGAEERLSLVKPSRRGDYVRSAPRDPLQWLEFDEELERRISDICNKVFGECLVLNTLAGDEIFLNVTREIAPDIADKGAREQARWLASLPRLESQGDGMKSFIGTLMGVLVHPRSIMLIDEPEAFLHSPQKRRLAEIIAGETALDSQIIIATHDDEFLRGILDSSGGRVVVARLTRIRNDNYIRIIDNEKIRELWSDPILRSSDILSALFHDLAILVEGETDARFFHLLMEATRGDVRDLDSKIFQLGGKARIKGVAKALRAISVPVAVIVDIDILSNKGEFYSLFEALGGDRAQVEGEINQIHRAVEQRGSTRDGAGLARVLRDLAEEADGMTSISKEILSKITSLAKPESPWRRLKEDGAVVLNGDDYIAFQRVLSACAQVGILINPEGELEGFCRDKSRRNKAEWLEHVVGLDLSSDPRLDRAREFAASLRRAAERVVHGT